MPEDTPAYLSLQFAVAGSNRYRGRIGRHNTNLFDVLRSDLTEKGLKLRSGRDLVRLRRWRLTGRDGADYGGTDCDIKMSPGYFCRRNSLMMMKMMVIYIIMRNTWPNMDMRILRTCCDNSPVPQRTYRSSLVIIPLGQRMPNIDRRWFLWQASSLWSRVVVTAQLLQLYSITGTTVAL